MLMSPSTRRVIAVSTALYRRYRPDDFSQVIGQEQVTAPLVAALDSGRITHAYLFSGPRGCGKTTSARILARCLNCKEGPTSTPCGKCDSCKELATGGPGSLDVVEIDAASHNGVDDARELRERAAFAPVRDRYKIFILDEAHMVTQQGFNALLKLVEEPPEHVKFIFATTEPDKVLGTIRSRTHHYPFRLVPPEVLEKYLEELCKKENIEVGAGVLPMVLRAGGGSVRDTLSVLDQLMAGAVDNKVDYHRAVSLLGYTDSALLDAATKALAEEDGKGIYEIIEQMVESGHDPRRFVEDLLQRLRDLLILAVAGKDAKQVLHALAPDQVQRMVELSSQWGSRAISRAADLTAQALTKMVGATSPRLQLELLVARILLPQTEASDTAPKPVASGSARGGRAQAMRAQVAQSSRSATAETAPAKAATDSQSPSSPSQPASAPSAAIVRDNWQKVLQAAELVSPQQAAYLSNNVRPGLIENGKLLIQVPNAQVYQMVTSPGQTFTSALEGFIQQALQINVGISVQDPRQNQAGQAGPAALGNEAPAAPDSKPATQTPPPTSNGWGPIAKPGEALKEEPESDSAPFQADPPAPSEASPQPAESARVPQKEKPAKANKRVTDTGSILTVVSQPQPQEAELPAALDNTASPDDPDVDASELGGVGIVEELLGATVVDTSPNDKKK